MSATIKYKGNTIASITTDSSKTLKTSGKYCEGDIVVENVQDGGITPSGNKAITATTSTQTGIDVTNYATVSVAPTPSETKSVTTNGDVTPSSGKLLSKVTVNVPTGTARDSSDLTVSGATVNVPAGLYSSAASKSVASGTAGTPTASKSAVSNNSVTVTPSVTNTTGYITGGTKTGTGVKVSASELVSGNKAITPSETAQSGIDVTNFKTASVGAISSTYVGSGVSRKAAATVAPSTSEQTVCASGVYTTGAQKVSAITKELLASLDADFIADNIKKDVDLFGLIGTLEAGGGGGGAKISTGNFTPSEDTTTFTISHGLGVKPDFIAIFGPRSYSSDYALFLCRYRNKAAPFDSYLNEIYKSKGNDSYRYGDAERVTSYGHPPISLDNEHIVLNTSSIGKGPNNSAAYLKSGIVHKWIAIENSGMYLS